MSRLVKVAVTGAAGNIGYAMLFRLASGEVFGHDTHVSLHLLEIPPAMKALEGTVMELNDCAFPLLDNIVMGDDPNVVFDGVNWALLVGAKPRTKGMERGDLILDNGPIFVGQGKALTRAADDLRVLVIGNPANTNCLIAVHHADGVPKERFAAMTRLDQNRAMSQLATKADVAVSEVTNITIWGNHSATQYPDVENGKIGGKPVFEVIDDHDWLRGDFISTVQKRGAAIIKARGASSAASAASAGLDHVMSMLTKTAEGNWISSAVASDGSYGVDEGLFFSFPVISDGEGGYSIVQELPMSGFAKEKFNKTLEELRSEKETVAHLLT